METTKQDNTAAKEIGRKLKMLKVERGLTSAAVCEKAGIKRLSMHDLRHTMATRFTEQSTDYKRLSAMLGHSSIRITVDTYVHETQDSIDVATDKFSSYLDELFD